MRSLVRSFINGESPDAKLIRSKGGKSVWRVRIESESTVIAKLWQSRGRSYRVRRLTRTTNARYEYCNLHRLQQHDSPAPSPFGYCYMDVNGREIVEAVFVEDLGPCITGTEFIRRLLDNDNRASLRAFNDAIVHITVSLIRAGIVDTDHSVINIVVPERGMPVRVDLETARWTLSPRLSPRRYSHMLGRLIGTYVFAVQPQLELVGGFCKQLNGALRPTRHVKRRADAIVTKMLDDQRIAFGIDSRIVLPW